MSYIFLSYTKDEETAKSTVSKLRDANIDKITWDESVSRPIISILSRH